MNERLVRRLAKLETLQGAKAEAPTIDVSRLSDGLLLRILTSRDDLSGLSEDDLAELEAARIDKKGGRK